MISPLFLILCYALYTVVHIKDKRLHDIISISDYFINWRERERDFGFPPFLLLVGVAIKTKIIRKMESVKIFSAAQHVPELKGPAFDEIAPHDVRNKSHFMI